MKCIKLKTVKDKLKKHDKNYFIYNHKTIHHRWEIAHHPRGQQEPADRSYPITARNGWDTSINIQKLNAIANHFGLPKDLFKQQKLNKSVKTKPTKSN